MTRRYRYADYVTEAGVELHLEEYVEIKKTPKGAWVRLAFKGIPVGKKCFVLDGYGRRKCHQTKEQAWESFKLRKASQKRNAKHALERAEYALRRIDDLGHALDTNMVLGVPDFWHNYVFD